MTQTVTTPVTPPVSTGQLGYYFVEVRSNTILYGTCVIENGGKYNVRAKSFCPYKVIQYQPSQKQISLSRPLLSLIRYTIYIAFVGIEYEGHGLSDILTYFTDTTSSHPLFLPSETCTNKNHLMKNIF